MTPAHIIHNDRVEEAERLGAEWREQAACREYGPDLFYPVSASGKPAPDFEAALAICRRCPVIDACLRYATTAGEVRGGYTMLGHVVAGCRPRAKGDVGRPPGPARGLVIGEKARCRRCRATFTATGSGQRYCTKACARAARAEAKRRARRAL